METEKQSEKMQAQLPFSTINQGKQYERKQRENQTKECKHCSGQHDKGRRSLLENYAKTARNGTITLKNVCPNQLRELTISIMKANATQEMKTPTYSFLIRFSKARILKHKVKLPKNRIRSRCAQTKMNSQRK